MTPEQRVSPTHEPIMKVQFKSGTESKQLINQILKLRRIYTIAFLTAEERSNDYKNYRQTGDPRFDLEAGLFIAPDTLIDPEVIAPKGNLTHDMIIELQAPIISRRNEQIRLYLAILKSDGDPLLQNVQIEKNASYEFDPKRGEFIRFLQKRGLEPAYPLTQLSQVLDDLQPALSRLKKGVQAQTNLERLSELSRNYRPRTSNVQEAQQERKEEKKPMSESEAIIAECFKVFQKQLPRLFGIPAGLHPPQRKKLENKDISTRSITLEELPGQSSEIGLRITVRSSGDSFPSLLDDEAIIKEESFIFTNKGKQLAYAGYRMQNGEVVPDILPVTPSLYNYADFVERVAEYKNLALNIISSRRR